MFPLKHYMLHEGVTFFVRPNESTHSSLMQRSAKETAQGALAPLNPGGFIAPVGACAWCHAS